MNTSPARGYAADIDYETTPGDLCGMVLGRKRAAGGDT